MNAPRSDIAPQTPDPAPDGASLLQRLAQEALQALPVGIALHDGQGRLLLANEAAARIEARTAQAGASEPLHHRQSLVLDGSHFGLTMSVDGAAPVDSPSDR